MDIALQPPSDADEIATRIESDPRLASAATIRELIDLIPNARHIAVAAVFRCLSARKWYFEKGSAVKKFEPDFKTQLDAAKLLLSYSDGLPAQTTLNVNADLGKKSADVDGEAQFDAGLASSPALRDSLRRRLERAESAQKRTITAPDPSP